MIHGNNAITTKAIVLFKSTASLICAPCLVVWLGTNKKVSNAFTAGAYFSNF